MKKHTHTKKKLTFSLPPSLPSPPLSTIPLHPLHPLPSPPKQNKTKQKIPQQTKKSPNKKIP
jgi:hypothetical protein